MATAYKAAWVLMHLQKTAAAKEAHAALICAMEKKGVTPSTWSPPDNLRYARDKSVNAVGKAAWDSEMKAAWDSDWSVKNYDFSEARRDARQAQADAEASEQKWQEKRFSYYSNI